MDGQTDRTKLIGAIFHFLVANVPKNPCSFWYLICSRPSLTSLLTDLSQLMILRLPATQTKK
jgi:hypothetical protein